MKTAQVNGDKIVLKEIDELTLGDKKGAIVRVLGCGLCGSDIVKFKHKIVKDGAVLGHEIVALIEEVNTDTDFKIGDIGVAAHGLQGVQQLFVVLPQAHIVAAFGQMLGYHAAPNARAENGNIIYFHVFFFWRRLQRPVLSWPAGA